MTVWIFWVVRIVRNVWVWHRNSGQRGAWRDQGGVRIHWQTGLISADLESGGHVGGDRANYGLLLCCHWPAWAVKMENVVPSPLQESNCKSEIKKSNDQPLPWRHSPCAAALLWSNHDYDYMGVGHEVTQTYSYFCFGTLNLSRSQHLVQCFYDSLQLTI